MGAVSEGMLKEHMGLLYFLAPWHREQVKRRLKIAAAVEQELDAISVGDNGKEGNDFFYEFAYD